MNFKTIKVEGQDTHYVMYENGDIYNTYLKRIIKPICVGGFKTKFNLSIAGDVYTLSFRKTYASLFIDNPHDFRFVGFVDGDKNNFSLDNVYWMPNVDKSVTKEYELLDREGKLIVVDNLKSFCEENNLSYACMRRVVTHNQKAHKGYQLAGV